MAYTDETAQREAEQKYGTQRVQEWLAKNPGDLSRINSAFESDNISKTNTPGTPISQYTGSLGSSPWGGGGAPTGPWGTSNYLPGGSREPGTGGVDPNVSASWSTGGAATSSPWGNPTYMRFSSQAPTTGGTAPPGTPPAGGLTREQVIQMVDNLKTEGIKGASGFDLYYGVGKTPQEMLDYMNRFGQQAGNSQWNWSAGDLAPEFRNWQGGSAGSGAPDRRTELYDMLMGRAQQGLNLTGEDPIIKGQVDHYRAESERARRNLQSDMAEGGKAMTPTQLAMSQERTGRDVGGFQAELMGRELSARRQEISEALALGADFLTEGDRLSLQRELGLLDNEIRKHQLTLQGQDLALRRELGIGGLGNDLLRTLLGNQQFYSDLGYRSANSAAEWDARRRGL